MKTEKFNVGGMTCAACQANVTKCVLKIDGVEDVNVNLLAGNMTVRYDETRSDSDTISAAVCAIGYKTESLEKTGAGSLGTKKSKTEAEWNRRTQEAAKARKNLLWRWVSSLCLLIPLMYIAMGHMLGSPLPAVFGETRFAPISALTQLLITLVIVIINNKFFVKGIPALIKRVPNMDSLVSVGAGAARVYGVFVLYRM